MLRQAPAVLWQAPAALGTAAAARQFATTPQKPADEEGEESYELLPPGCSLKDPTYGRSFGGKHTRCREGWEPGLTHWSSVLAAARCAALP